MRVQVAPAAGRALASYALVPLVLAGAVVSAPASGVAPLGKAVMVPLRDIKPYKGNPRKIPRKAVEQVAESIRVFGWQQPIVVDAAGVIILGHTRLAAAKLLGESHAPVIAETRLTDAQVRALRIADNRTHDYTTWDYGQLASELDDLPDDFARVLDLADWEGIVDEFERAKAAKDLPVTQDQEALLTREHLVTLVFATQAEADKAGPDLLEVPGVIHVRYPK